MTALIIFVLALLKACTALSAAAEEPTRLTIYKGPKTMTSSPIATVSANGYDLFVYDVMVNHEHIWNANTQPTRTPMTYFDFEGKVRVEISMPGLEKPVESAKVIPQSHGIEPTVRDGKVSFVIDEPGQYTVIFNDSVNKALHIFANPLETDIPDPNDPNVYYIGPGEWVMDAIALQDNQTLYISGGAVLHSIVSVANAKNVRICGRGIIDGSDYPALNQPGSYARVPIDLNHAKDVQVEGIILANSNCWNFNSYSSKNVTIDNVKIISGRQNGGSFTVKTVAVCLNPSSIWEPRIQEIAVWVSADGEAYTEVAAAEKYQFDPATGNRIRIDFNAVDAAFVKVVFTMNSSSRTGGAQAAEICVY